MDKIELKVTMEPERLDALRYFLSAKEKRTPEKELQRLLEELYEKYVPADTREYLDSKNKPAVRPRPRRTAKGGRTAQTQDNNNDQDMKRNMADTTGLAYKHRFILNKFAPKD